MGRKAVLRRCVTVTMILSMMFGLCMPAFSTDTFLTQTLANYSSAIASKKSQCDRVYAYLTSIMDYRYIPKVYDLIYRAQYRLSLYDGDDWPYYNEGDFVTRVEDNVLGTIPILEAKGCNSYARYCAQYIRGTQGTLVRCSDFLGKEATYLPTGSEIKRFIETYADVGERVLTGYYRNQDGILRPHSLLFLGQDPQKDGFYFICQDGDRNGQTLRYMTFEYMATRLRYYEDFGYCLAMGDSNRGRDDSHLSTSIIGSVDQVSFGQQSNSAVDGNEMRIDGWAVSRGSEEVTVEALVNGKIIATAIPTMRSDIAGIYPAWCEGNLAGFDMRVDTSSLPNGQHDVVVRARTATSSITLKRVRIEVDSMVYKVESPFKDPTFITEGTGSVPVSGWIYDRNDANISVRAEIVKDGVTLQSAMMTTTQRPDIASAQNIPETNIGFRGDMQTKDLAPGEYELRLTAITSTRQVNISSVTLYVRDAAAPIAPYSMEVLSYPKKLQYSLGEKFDSTGLQLRVVYTDGREEIRTDGFACSAIDYLSSGNQTVTISFGALQEQFTVYVLPVENPGQIELTMEELYIAVGDHIEIGYECKPALTEGCTILWQSSYSQVASVDDHGVVTAKSKGVAEITATVYNVYGEEVSSSTVEIRVRSKLGAKIARLLDKVFALFGIKLHQNF